MQIPFNALYTFQLAIRLGSLKRTADHLSLTESAVSHQLKRLEKQLGQTLLIKQGRQLKPTRLGQKLAERLETPFFDIAQALKALEHEQEGLILYVQPSLLDLWLLPKVLHFREAHPDITLSIKYLASAPEFLSESHLAIRGYEADYRTTNQLLPVLDGETVVVCSPLYSGISKLISPEDLINATLLHDHSAESWQDWFANIELDLTLKPELVYEDFHLLKSAALAAQGVALCPKSLIEKELDSGKLIQLFDRKGNIGRKYGLEFASYAHSNLKLLVAYLRNA